MKMILSKDVSLFQCQYFNNTCPRSKGMLQFRGATNDATQPSGRTRELNSLKKPLCLFIRPKLVTGCLQIVNPNYKQILRNRHRRTNCAELEIELSTLALRGRCQGSLPLLERGHEEESCPLPLELLLRHLGWMSRLAFSSDLSPCVGHPARFGWH
jgi:hypothetical protein